MKKRSKIILLFGVIASTVFASCEAELQTYDGPTVVEFAPATASIKKGTTAAPGTYTAKVNLVGPQQGSDIVIDYEVDATATTAAAANSYAIEGTAGKITIPANTSFGYVKLNVVPANFPTTGSKTVKLVLKGNAAVPASENYKTFTLTITQ
jgi:hypothetical protein